ncbi:MAG: NUDIX domain-containing protein [Clostridia bacterium]|nr:NUDIX domain-containing protein [Clostridia bacterium]
MSRDILFDHGNARFSYRISALIVQGGRALLQCPVGTQDYAFIGGHVSFGETAKDTLIREIREEIHCDAAIGDLMAVGEVYIDWGRCPDGSPRHCHQIGLYFHATVDETQLPKADRFCGYDEAGNERYNLEYIWFPLEELREKIASKAMIVYPPEAMAHLLSGSKDVLHFTYTELPEDTLWPD